MAEELKLNLTKVLTREAKNVIAAYRRLMSRGQGVELDQAPKKQKGKGVWMIDTGATKSNGFAFTVRKTSMKVYAPNSKHPSGKVTYKDIFNWHNMKNYSGVFNKLPAGSKFPERVVKEVGRQVFKWARSQMKNRRYG